MTSFNGSSVLNLSSCCLFVLRCGQVHDKVWLLNDDTGKVLTLLCTFYERFEAANKDVCDVDRKFDIEFDEVETLSMVAAMTQTRNQEGGGL